MTERISELNPNLYLVGLYIQENALKGYKLVEGYPTMHLWQYETVMEKSEVASNPMDGKPAPKEVGRPPKAQ